MAVPQVNYQAGFLPQGAYDQINRNITQGGQGLLQAQLAKQEREMKTLEMFGNSVGGLVNQSREDKKLARDNAKEIYDRDMNLARKELDSFKVGTDGYQKASEKIEKMQEQRDSALKAFDDQGFFSRDDSILDIGPEQKEISEQNQKIANKHYADADRIYSEQRPLQDEVNALKSGGGMIARNLALQKIASQKSIKKQEESFKPQYENLNRYESEIKKLEAEEKKLQKPEDKEQRKDVQKRINFFKESIQEFYEAERDETRRVDSFKGEELKKQKELETSTQYNLSGLGLDDQQKSLQQKKDQVSESLTKASLAENDTSVPEGMFRSALTGELYKTDDLKVDEARDFQINVTGENQKQKEDDQQRTLLVNALGNIKDPSQFQEVINKIPDTQIKPEVKEAMIIANRSGFKADSIEAVMQLKGVYGDDKEGFFNHVKTAKDPDGNLLLPALEGVTYTDSSQRSLTQSLITRAASTGALTKEQLGNYEVEGIITPLQSEALEAISEEYNTNKELKTDIEKKALAIRGATVMGGQALVNEYIKQGILPQGTKYDDSVTSQKEKQRQEERMQGYKVMALNNLVKSGDLDSVQKFLATDSMKFMDEDLKQAVYTQSVNENQVIQESKAIVATEEGRKDERLQMAVTAHQNAKNAEERSQAMHLLRTLHMRRAEARAVDDAGRRRLQELRSAQRFDRENENNLYQVIRESAGPGEALAYLKSVRPQLKGIDHTDFEKLERSVRFKVSSGQGTITQDEADAYGVDKTSLQASVDEKKDNVELQKLSQKLLRGTEFVGADAETEARLLGFNSAKEANDYIKFERNGLITRRLTALGNNYKEIEELQKTVGKNTGGVDFKTRITEAKQSKAQDKVNKLYDNLFRTAHLGATDLVDSTFNSMTTQDFEFKELQKQGFISGDVVKNLKKSFKEVEKIKHDKVLIDRRTQGISEVESYLGQYYGANDEGKKQLKDNMERVNNEKMLGFDINSLITTQTASTKLKLAKDKAIAEKAIIDLKRAALDEANRLKTEKGELSTEDIKKITTNLVQAKLKNPYDPNVDASEIVKGVDSIRSILSIFAQTGKVELDPTELD